MWLFRRELLGTLFCARNITEGPAPDEIRLRPGGSFPVRDQEAPRPIPNGPLGAPHEGNPSSWEKQDNSWRSPFKGEHMPAAAMHQGSGSLTHEAEACRLTKLEHVMLSVMDELPLRLHKTNLCHCQAWVICAGSPSGTQPIRSRLVDDSPAVISPPGGPPGLNMRRSALQGPPGGGEWHPDAEGWRRTGGPPQEWRGPPGPIVEDDVPTSPRRQANSWASQVRLRHFTSSSG